MLSSRYADAVAYATDAHAGQVRKGTSIPYITHPIAVSALVLEFGGDEDLAIAGVLHDVVEDCGVTVDDLMGKFGERVADLVEACTDGVPDETGRKPAWRTRKETYLSHLQTASADLLLVSICDKIHNARAIEADRSTIGDAVFDRFTAGRAGTYWYYWALHDVFKARLGEMAAPVVALRTALNRTYN
jgi:GTP pyrophosphokinase